MLTTAATHPVVAAVREFVAQEVQPAAPALEHADRYPHELVARMRGLGLFGALVPREYGGLGLDSTAYAMVIEELCRGWMSLAGVINSHTMAALIVLQHGTEEQRRRLLPRFAAGEARGGLCLTEPQAGSDVQAIRTVARRQGDRYLLTGTKMFVTNGREGNAFALLALTDPAATPRHRGMSCFIVEKGPPGLQVAKSIAKLGYKGVDTAELVFEEFPVPALNLVGGVEGRGFKQVMSGLETGRINIAARAVGVAQAAFDEAWAHARARGGDPPAALADMATRLAGARRLTYWAAAMKDRGERADLEAGMAKLYASEAAQAVAVAGMGVIGEAAARQAGTAERHYRDTPLMLIGEGTNEIQRLVIARNLLERHGEQAGAPTSREGLPEDARQVVLAVRQFVDKHAGPAVPELERAGRYPREIVDRLAELGVFGALVPPEWGGLGLPCRTWVMVVEELARGWTTLAALVAAHSAVAHLVARHGAPERRQALLPAMARGERLGALALAAPARARPSDGAWRLSGVVPGVENATRAHLFALLGATERGPALFLVERDARGLSVGAPEAVLGGRGLDPADLTLEEVGLPGDACLGAGPAADGLLALAHLGAAAGAVGLAQAALEAALRYSRQRTAFGQPICQHQAIQLKLADMATAVTASRLLAEEAAGALDEGAAGGVQARIAKLHAARAAADVALEAMRIHGGYGYTAEFPVERYYRDAARLLLALGGPEGGAADLARRLAGG
jgi:alkylation response protein AidB-like acyl-CoA dehydrogenase